MTAPKVHIWRTSLRGVPYSGTGPPMAQAWCGAHLPEAVEWAVRSSENPLPTCLHCVRAVIAEASFAISLASRDLEALLPVERRLSKQRRRKKL